MSGLASQFRTNIIYGAIALLPVAVLVYILVKLFGFLKKLAEPLSPYLSTNPYLDIVLLLAVTVFALISECKIVQALVVALAPALQHGVLPCQKGFSVGFTAAAALVHELLEVRDEKGSCASSASSPATSC